MYGITRGSSGLPPALAPRIPVSSRMHYMYKKGGNEKRDRRRQLVKLVSALKLLRWRFLHYHCHASYAFSCLS